MRNNMDHDKNMMNPHIKNVLKWVFSYQVYGDYYISPIYLYWIPVTFFLN